MEVFRAGAPVEGIHVLTTGECKIELLASDATPEGQSRPGGRASPENHRGTSPPEGQYRDSGPIARGSVQGYLARKPGA